jgi:copper(I)-binding protein
MMKRRSFLASGALLAFGASIAFFSMDLVSLAHEYEVGKIKVQHPWLRAPQDGDNKAQFN